MSGKDGYGYNPNQYNQQYPGQYPPGQAPVVMGQPGHHQTIVVQAAPPRPSSYLGLAIFVTICCNLLFGIIAIIFSVMSSSAADEGNMETARSNGKVSMGLSIAGILITIVVIIIIVVYVTVFATKTVNEFCNGSIYNCDTSNWN